MSGREVGLVELIVGTAVVVAALIALLVPRRLACVVSFLVFGVLLAVLWALAGAPDVALAEAALGAGVTGVLLIDTVSRSRPLSRQEDPTSGSAGWWSGWLPAAVGTTVATVLLTAGLAPALWQAAAPLDEGTPGLSEPVGQVLPRTGVDHGVTGVLLNLRSYDTLLEVVVLLVAVLAALVLGRQDHDPDDLPARAPPSSAAVPPLQSAATGILVPALVLLAAWLLFAGSSRPGGAFQSGAVLAALVLLLHLADRPVLPFGSRRTRLVPVAGVLAFVLVAAVGPALGGAWLQLDPAWAGPVIVALETVLAVAIGASLALVALSLRQEPSR